MTPKAQPRTVKVYSVGWIAALAHERAAAVAMLDEEHEKPPDFTQHPSDKNAYTWGKASQHYVIIASLPFGRYGVTSAAITAHSLRSSLPHIHIALLVGIGAGIPGEITDERTGKTKTNHDIRLGDVVVSSPDGTNGGVVQYDLIKAKSVGNKVSYERKGYLNSPPDALLNALSALQAKHQMEDSQIPVHLHKALERFPKMRSQYTRPDTDMSAGPGAASGDQDSWEPVVSDTLFLAAEPHFRGDNCNECDMSRAIKRRLRASTAPEIHYGAIASGNSLVKSAEERDAIVSWLEQENVDVHCIEMEAAGLMNTFPCLVIRGICDYADSHKNDKWQKYAALTAAAFAKELLGIVDVQKVLEAPRIGEEDVAHVRSEVQHSAVGSRLAELERWLSPPDLTFNFTKALEQRHPGTGSWLLHGKSFAHWKVTPDALLWLHGIPGCGKTVLATSIIEHLQSLRNQKKGSENLVIYFYFDFNDTDKQTMNAMARSLIWQCARQSKNIHQSLDSLCRSFREGIEQANTEALLETLHRMLESSKVTRVVIDALDECKTRPDLLAWLKGLLKTRHRNIQLIVTSRREEDIIRAIDPCADESEILSIPEDEVNEDIRAYIQARITDPDGGLSRWHSHPNIQTEIMTALMEKAQGMYVNCGTCHSASILILVRFRWAACQLDVLEGCRHRKSLRKALSSLPTTLAETYNRVLANIPEDDRPDAIRLLQFLTYSARPLRLDEGVDVLAVSLEDGSFDPQDRMPNARDIVGTCPSLVSIVQVGSNHDTFSFDYVLGLTSGEERLEDHLQLAHCSVREYVISGELAQDFRSQLEPSGARAAMAKVSLTYLLSLDQSLSIRHIRTEFPLSLFSARYWMDDSSRADVDVQLRDLILQVLDHEPTRQFWLKLWNPEYPWQGDPLEELQGATRCLRSPLYYAAFGGLSPTVRFLLNREDTIDNRNDDYGNALWAAATNGHTEIVHLLLERGVGSDVRIDDQQAALHTASKNGNLEIVRLLLDDGNEKFIQDGFLANAIEAASSEGHLEVVRLLLVTGRKRKIGDRSASNALQAASRAGHPEVVRLLLTSRADHSIPDESLSIATQAASKEGHVEVVRLLLANGADVNAQRGFYGNAIQAASREGQIEVLRLLLAEGADVNAQIGFCGSALQAACWGGHLETVRFLLANGAYIGAEGRYPGNAVQIASRGGFQEIVQLLRTKGVFSSDM